MHTRLQDYIANAKDKKIEMKECSSSTEEQQDETLYYDFVCLLPWNGKFFAMALQYEGAAAFSSFLAGS